MCVAREVGREVKAYKNKKDTVLELRRKRAEAKMYNEASKNTQKNASVTYVGCWPYARNHECGVALLGSISHWESARRFAETVWALSTLIPSHLGDIFRPAHLPLGVPRCTEMWPCSLSFYCVRILSTKLGASPCEARALRNLETLFCTMHVEYVEVYLCWRRDKQKKTFFCATMFVIKRFRATSVKHSRYIY